MIYKTTKVSTIFVKCFILYSFIISVFIYVIDSKKHTKVFHSVELHAKFTCSAIILTKNPQRDYLMTSLLFSLHFTQSFRNQFLHSMQSYQVEVLLRLRCWPTAIEPSNKKERSKISVENHLKKSNRFHKWMEEMLKFKGYWYSSLSGSCGNLNRMSSNIATP